MERHLTAEDLDKYMDTSDLTEDYLLWMEKASEHLSKCPQCQKALQKALDEDCICEEEGFAAALTLAQQEEEIRRSILICKLQQMEQQERMAQLIRKLQSSAAIPYVFQMKDIQKKAGIARGEDRGSAISDHQQGLEITCEEHVLKVIIPHHSKEQQVTVLLEQPKKTPMICEAIRDKIRDQWIAEFPVWDTTIPFEIYVIP